jgi:hypothetical protein
MKRQVGFTNQPIEIPIQPQNTFSVSIHGITGVVLSINRKRQLAKVKTIVGDIKSNVRIPGPSLDNIGNANGRWQQIRVNQLVFVGYVMGVQNSPYILQSYPYYATEKDFDNLRTFVARYPEIMENEMVDFHESGYCVRYASNKIIFQDALKQEKFSIDMLSGEVKVQDSLTVGSGLYNAIKTPSLTQWMNDVYMCLQSLKTAIDSAVIIPLDGGASLKTAMSSALASAPPPPTPIDISATNASFGDPI